MSTSTVTDDFKRVLIDNIYNDFYDSDTKYYIGIGRSQPWDFPDSDLSPPEPNPSALEVLDFVDGLQTVKRVSDISHVTPRYNWTNGAIYSGWNNRYHSNNLFIAGQNEDDPFYVITSNNSVYVCIKQAVNNEGLAVNSTVPPLDQTGSVFETSDGYQWKYLYSVGTTATQKFLTSSYLPAQEVYDSAGSLDLDPFEQEQATLQLNAVPGEIIGVEIELTGENFVDGTYELAFDGTPLIENGVEKTITPARAWARVANGIIVDVSMKDPTTGNYYFGENYYNATARFLSAVSGDSYRLRPIIGPDIGLGASAQRDLNSTAIMFNVILSGDEDGGAIIDNDFRQVGLIRNPEVVDSDGLGNPTQGLLDTTSELLLSAVKYDVLNVGGSLNLGNIAGDNIMTGQSSNAKAVIASTDVGNDLFYYTQSRETGYKDFQVGENIDISDGGGTTKVLDINQNGFIKQSGDVYYIDSRRPFMRSGEQSEDIKLVIDF